MKGTLYVRGPGVFELRVEGGYDPRSGARRRVSGTYRGTKRDANQALRALIAEVEQGAHRGTVATLDELLNEWLRLHGPDLATSTRVRYLSLLDRHVRSALGSLRLSRLGPYDLTRFYAELVEAGLAPSTVRQVHAIVRKALAEGVRWGWIAENPADKSTRPRVAHHEVTLTPLEVVQHLLSAAQRRWPEFGVFLFVAAMTGARRGELCGLRWGDLDLGAALPTVRLQRAVNDAGGAREVKDTKTHQSRLLSLDAAAPVLQAHRADMERRAGGSPAPDAYVFSDSLDGAEPWWPDRVSDTFRRLCRVEGVHGVRLHDLRHWAGSEALAGGVDIRTVAGRLGHRQTSTTLNIYAHVLPAADQAAAALLGSRLRLDPAREEAPPLSAEGVTE